jgi:hypothetical protein
MVNQYKGDDADPGRETFASVGGGADAELLAKQNAHDYNE